MMRYNVNALSGEYNFDITGASYAGAPRDNTVMYISKKVGHLVQRLFDKKGCLVFLENGIEVPKELKKENCFLFSDNPQYAYAGFAARFAEEQRRQEAEWGYTWTSGGYYVGKDVKVGTDAYIELGALIGHHVTIGDHAVILAGSVIKNAVVGNHFFCNENAVIGGNCFTMAEDEDGNKFRIPALGRVVIGNHVEIGVCDNISAGACGDTQLDDYVKLDALVHIGHEAHLHKNTEIVAGVIIGGFAELDEHSYAGMNASIKNRIYLGENCIIGMGSNVTKPVEADVTVVGNPAALFRRGKKAR